MKYSKTLALFALGGSTYVGLELLWRGRSHVSMLGAGGLSFLLLGKVRKSDLPLAGKAVTGSAMITAVELATGLLVNRDYRVWDYRNCRGNFLGQICPAYALLWAPLSLAAMELHGWLEERLSRE